MQTFTLTFRVRVPYHERIGEFLTQTFVVNQSYVISDHEKIVRSFANISSEPLTIICEKEIIVVISKFYAISNVR